MLAGGAIVGTALQVARGANAYGSDTIKVGLVGSGARGTAAAVAALNTATADSNVQLFAMADVLESQLQTSFRTIKSKHPSNVDVEGRRFAGFDGFAKLLATDVDVVILASPPGFRPLHFESAVNAGKHIFMEKPVATDAPGVRRVLSANEIAKQSGLAVQVGLQRRHELRYQECIQRLQDGAIGDLMYARAYWNGSAAKIRPRQKKESELQFQIRNWPAFTWLGGDQISEQHVHNLDVINWLMQNHPIEAQGQGGRHHDSAPCAGQVFDHHTVEFTYPGGFKLFSQCRHVPGCWNNIGEHAHGSVGSADISNALIRGVDGKKAWQSETKEVKGKGLQQQFFDLFASLRKGEVHNEADYAAISTMTSIMGRMATYSGRVVKWEDAFASVLQLANVDGIRSFADPAPVEPDENGHYPVAIPGSKTKFV